VFLISIPISSVFPPIRTHKTKNKTKTIRNALVECLDYQIPLNSFNQF